MKNLLAKQNPLLIKTVQKIAHAIPRTLVVGGFVRDALLGIQSKDADIEVYGVEPKRLETLLNELFPGQVIEAGKAFAVLKIPIGDGMDIDVTLPRRESKTGKGHKGFLVESDPNMTVEEALRRRDFTINAIAADPLTGEIIDPFDGQSDLKKKVLRVVDPKTFPDDPLRVYRAIQFAARFGLTIEQKSFTLMRQMVERGDLSELSKERVTDEIKKLLLKAEKPSIGFQLAWDLGIIERDYPELFVLKQTPQEPQWHPEGDVWIHTLMVIDQAAKIIRQPYRQLTDEEKLQVMLGALCHDLGKPSTTKMGEKEGVPRLRSLGHEEAGEEPTRILCSKWTFGHETEHAAILIATQHLKPGMLYLQKEKGSLTEENYVNAVRKLIKKIHPLSWRAFLAAAESDYRGRGTEDAGRPRYPHGELFAETVIKYELDKEPTKPLVLGRDVLARGIKPGPHIGELVNQIEVARDEGKIKTREEALKYLGELLK